jgi:hypothetical protein
VPGSPKSRCGPQAKYAPQFQKASNAGRGSCAGTTEKRTVEWLFEGLDTLRRTIIARAGRLTRPRGKLTLTLNANPTVRGALLRLLEA